MLVDDKIIQRYLEPHRHYHTLEHIYAGLAVGHEVFHQYMSADVIAAWWFHDAVYEIGAKDNEVRSAALAKQMGFSYDVQLLVKATIYPNTNLEPSISEAVINDMDLWGFSTPPAVYNHHTEQIRKEYPDVTDEEFKAGRKAFLRKLITEQPELYKTAHGKKYWMAQAMKNILKDILD